MGVLRYFRFYLQNRRKIELRHYKGLNNGPQHDRTERIFFCLALRFIV